MQSKCLVTDYEMEYNAMQGNACLPLALPKTLWLPTIQLQFSTPDGCRHTLETTFLFNQKVVRDKTIHLIDPTNRRAKLPN